MKFSYRWLSELAGLGEPAGRGDAAAKELGRLITMKTAECEGVQPFGAHFDAVCAARVLAIEPIGDGHNRKVTADTGRYGVKTVVCGAANCRPGLLTAYVPAGITLGHRAIRMAVIQGVESDGMLASGAELGINRDHEGILELDGVEPGDPIPSIAPDWIIEIDNKSLTHRPDLWGHFGMAREVAAICRQPLRDPVHLDLLPTGVAPVHIEIADFVRCPRYSALLFENVTVQPSPLWLQYRLEAIGLNPINNIVDVTNFVMAELAQPMHAFDADKLRGHTIFVRPAAAGESYTALNGETYRLEPSDIVIADEGGAVALGGIIGGAGSAIGATTKRILLESANFQAGSIRRTSARLKLRTDASMRFEKAQDPLNTVRGLARATELLRLVSPGIRWVGGVADAQRLPPPAEPIALPLDWLRRKLGREVSAAEVREILGRLCFGVDEPRSGLLLVSVPSWRATRDVSIQDDLAEEVGRMVGYDTIPPAPPELPVRPPVVNEARVFERTVRQAVSAQGFVEVYNYSFVSEEQLRVFGMDPGEHMAVANPISSEQGLLRRSLLPGIWKNLRENSRHFDSFRLFEIGYEIHPRAGDLPDEIPHLAAAIFDKHDGVPGLMELKRLAECLMPGAVARPAEARPFEHPARVAAIHWRGEPVGRLFELHPNVLTGRGAVLDLDLARVRALQPPRARFQPPRRFPTSAFDLSVLAALRTPAGDIQDQLTQFAAEDLVSIEFLRHYTGPPLPEGRKSVSYRLTVGAPDRTLAAEDVAAIRSRVVAGMQALGYELRL